MKTEQRHRQPGFRILLVAFVFFAVAQTVWLAIDRRPVTEERHYFAAARMAHALRGTDIGRAYPETGYHSPYPPLPAYYTGAILAVAGCRADVASLSLLPFAWLLLWAVWKIGRVFFSGEAAAAGAVLVLCFHHFVDVEPLYAPYTFINEYMLDLPLSALLAVALYFLIRQLRTPVVESALRADEMRSESARYNGERDDHSERRDWTPLFLGLTVGLAMLIKVSTPLYILVAAAGLLLEGYRSRSGWLSLWLPAAIAAAVALPWYLLHIGDVAGYLVEHEFNAGLALRDGMPAVGSAENLLYYLKALQSMLSMPFVVLVVVSTLLIAVVRIPGRRLIVSGMVLSYLVLTVLWGKSWRFLTPCLVYPALAAAAAADIAGRRAGTRRAIVYGLVAAALLRMTFMYGAGPAATTEQGNIVRLASVKNDGGIERIMQDILRERDRDTLLRISVSPYLRRFRHVSFMQYALEHDIRMAWESEWRIRTGEWREELERSEFIITKTGYAGPARYVPHRAEIQDWLQARRGDSVQLVKEYPLADGSLARLFKQDRKFSNWRRLPAAGPQRPLVNFDDSILLTDCSVTTAGSNILVNCTWQAVSIPDREYRLFMQLRNGRRNIVARTFTPGDGLYPLIDWKKGERLTERYTMPLPAGRRAEDCELWLGWNRRFRRLPVKSSAFPELMNAVHVAARPLSSKEGTACPGNSNSGL